MRQNEIEQLLAESFADRKLSNEEKYQFAEISTDFRGEADKIAFIRNRAFAMVRDNSELSPEQYSALKWLENLVKTLDKNSRIEGVEADACFSPGNDCLNRIISLCKNARSSIDVCVFTISCNELTQALLDAHKRGIKVRIISDNDKRNDKGSDVYRLSDEGIPVVVDKTQYHMHHKFAVFDSQLLLNGSFNWTRSASKYNQENILVTDNTELVEKFDREFERLWRKLGS